MCAFTWSCTHDSINDAWVRLCGMRGRGVAGYPREPQVSSGRDAKAVEPPPSPSYTPSLVDQVRHRGPTAVPQGGRAVRVRQWTRQQHRVRGRGRAVQVRVGGLVCCWVWATAPATVIPPIPHFRCPPGEHGVTWLRLLVCCCGVCLLPATTWCSSPPLRACDGPRPRWQPK